MWKLKNLMQDEIKKKKKKKLKKSKNTEFDIWHSNLREDLKPIFH